MYIIHYRISIESNNTEDWEIFGIKKISKTFFATKLKCTDILSHEIISTCT